MSLSFDLPLPLLIVLWSADFFLIFFVLVALSIAVELLFALVRAARGEEENPR